MLKKYFKNNRLTFGLLLAFLLISVANPSWLNHRTINQRVILKEMAMIELIIGIIIGATFHDFWAQVFRYAKKKVANWTNDQKSTNE